MKQFTQELILILEGYESDLNLASNYGEFSEAPHLIQQRLDEILRAITRLQKEQEDPQPSPDPTFRLEDIKTLAETVVDHYHEDNTNGHYDWCRYCSQRQYSNKEMGDHEPWCPIYVALDVSTGYDFEFDPVF